MKSKAQIPAQWVDPARPFGILRFAEEYRRAADLVHQDGDLFNPAYGLIGLSIELSLKAYLVSRGMDEKSLSNRQFGHNLDALWSEAHRQRIDRLLRIPGAAGVVSVLNDVYMAHEFRYIRTGTRRILKWQLISGIARGLVDGLHDHCVRRALGKHSAEVRLSMPKFGRKSAAASPDQIG